jgi:hypothetical protein
MWLLADVQRLVRDESWKARIAYGSILFLALLYLVSQIGMAILWLAGQAQLDIV